MRRFALLLTLAASMMVTGVFTMTGATAETESQKAVVVFDEPTRLLNVTLKGQYLFVHDDGRMARGEDCTYVYTYTEGKPGDLVVSFHCRPVPRQKAVGFNVTVAMQSNRYELVEYQFAGSSEGHRVP
jgi:hypothetical protein